MVRKVLETTCRARGSTTRRTTTVSSSPSPVACLPRGAGDKGGRGEGATDESFCQVEAILAHSSSDHAAKHVYSQVGTADFNKKVGEISKF